MSDSESGPGSQADEAAAVIRAGGIVACPTEAVYGLSCDPDNPAAIERLLRTKQRASDKGLILVAATREQLGPYVLPFSEQLAARTENDWPGPVTWVVPARPGLPPLLTGHRQTLAVRVSAHPVLQALCTRLGKPLTSTSANLSGAAPATSAASVRAALSDTFDYLIDAPLGQLDKPTPIFDGQTFKQLR